MTHLSWGLHLVLSGKCTGTHSGFSRVVTFRHEAGMALLSPPAHLCCLQPSRDGHLGTSWERARGQEPAISPLFLKARISQPRQY